MRKLKFKKIHVTCQARERRIWGARVPTQAMWFSNLPYYMLHYKENPVSYKIEIMGKPCL